MKTPAFGYYMHDGPAAFSIELAGALAAEGAEKLEQDWRSATRGGWQERSRYRHLFFDRDRSRRASTTAQLVSEWGDRRRKHARIAGIS